MARANGLDNMSYADLLTLQEKIAAAIIARKAEDAKATKDQLRAYAEKAGFRLEELFGKRGSKGSGVAKYRNSKMPPRPGPAAAVSRIGLSTPLRGARKIEFLRSESPT